MAKPNEKLLSRKLRLEGNSIRSIANQLGVSRSSVSRWCSDITLSPQQLNTLNENSATGRVIGSLVASQNKRQERARRVKYYNQTGTSLIGNISSRELLLVGTALYWAEGSKKNRRVVLGNSDPKMIQIYIKWLTKTLNIDRNRIKCYVGINQAHRYRINSVLKYWSNVTNIPKNQFAKTSFKKVKNKKKYEYFENHYGTLFVEVRRGTNLNYQIIGQIEALKMAA